MGAKACLRKPAGECGGAEPRAREAGLSSAKPTKKPAAKRPARGSAVAEATEKRYLLISMSTTSGRLFTRTGMRLLPIPRLITVYLPENSCTPW